MRITKIQSADCTICGCNDTEELRPGRFQCNYCGQEFAAQPQVDPLTVTRYVEKRTPICPVHNVPMHNNGRPNQVSTAGERKVYFKCPSPGCSLTGIGSERLI